MPKLSHAPESAHSIFQCAKIGAFNFRMRRNYRRIQFSNAPKSAHSINQCAKIGAFNFRMRRNCRKFPDCQTARLPCGQTAGRPDLSTFERKCSKLTNIRGQCSCGISLLLVWYQPGRLAVWQPPWPAGGEAILIFLNFLNF